MTDYVPPRVWTWNKGNGGQFANINRPIAGPTHDKELPVGRHPVVSRREVRSVRAFEGVARAGRVPVVAVLADGQRAVSRRWLWPFLRLCACEDAVPYRPLRDGGQAPTRRSRSPARRQRV